MVVTSKNAELIERFSEMLCAERNSSKNTISAYTKDVENYLLFTNGTFEVSAQEYVKHLMHNNIKQSSIMRAVSSLRQFFGFLTDEKIIKKNIFEGIKVKNKDKPLPKILSESEMQSLLLFFEKKESTSSIRLKCILHILYACGIRISELVHLTMESVDVHESHIIVLGKGGKERIVPLHDLAIKSINEYIKIRNKYMAEQKFSKFLFPSNSSKHGHITRQGIAKLLKKTAVEAGISENKISPHVIRHAFATHLLSHGSDIMTIQRLLGHSSITTTQIYTHVSNDRVRKLVENHSNIKDIKIK